MKPVWKFLLRLSFQRPEIVHALFVLGIKRMTKRALKLGCTTLLATQRTLLPTAGVFAQRREMTNTWPRIYV